VHTAVTTVIDLSNYTGNLTPVNVAAVKGAGIGLNIGLQFPTFPNTHGWPQGVADRQMAALIAGGVTAWDVYFESTDPQTAWNKVSQYRSYMRQPWLAVEEGSGFTTEATIDAALAQIDAWFSTPCGIYTSKYEWDLLGLTNVTKYASRPWWDANYNGDENLVITEPYAGRSVSTMHQYAGTQHMFATVPMVDVSYREDAVAQSQAMSTNDAMGIWIKAWSMANGNAQAPMPDHIKTLTIQPMQQVSGSDVYVVTIQRS